MKNNIKTRTFDGTINSVPHVFYAEEYPNVEAIHLMIYEKDSEIFNNKDEPRYRIIMKNSLPEVYDLQRSIGYHLNLHALRHIVNKTVSEFNK